MSVDPIVPRPPTLAPAGSHLPGPLPRQMVNFVFFKLDPAFRRLPPAEKEQARDQYVAVLAEASAMGMICLSYATMGLRADVDFLLWRVAPSVEDFQTQTRTLNKTTLAGYLTTPFSLLSMTKRSMYTDKVDPFYGSESRTHIIAGQRKYLFVYPLVKSREWYLLPMLKRQEMMDVHVRIASKYPGMKQNTTFSFGLDDQDFVVAYETDEPRDFLNLVMEIRETEASRYTLSDTPSFTCVHAPMKEILDRLF